MSRRGPYRLTTGGQIDRQRPVSFHFDGRSYSGYAGDSLASALLGEGVRTVARSFKFHRPRGIFACGVEEPNALVTLKSGAHAIASARAPTVELTEGLSAQSQAGWPSVGFDIGRVLDATAPLWAAGFYNKTFIWPSWHTYEGIIRRMAGLGRAPVEPDPDRYELRNTFCDVLVVGGGRTGSNSAKIAGLRGQRVILAEQQSDAQLSSMPNVTVLLRTTAVGAYDHGVYTLVERPQRAGVRERLWIVRAKSVVLATGNIEQPLVFSNNDRPGIMLAGAAWQYVKRYGVAPGHRVLLATNNDTAYRVAHDLKKAGVNVAGLADSRSEISLPLLQQMKSCSVEVFPGTLPIDTSGFGALSRVTLGYLSGAGDSVSHSQTIDCDALAVSGGFAPALHLFAQAGGKLVYDELSGGLRPQNTLSDINIEGAAARAIPIGPRVSPVGRPNRQWVDLLHDVTVADLDLALREHYTSVEHVKRYTTVGMAADQGKTATAASLEVLGRLRRISASELGHTTLRPPVVPVTLGAIAAGENGERFAPRRLLPLHEWHAANGAVFEDFGSWQRPVGYPRANESREATAHREALVVRTAAGLLDGSPLGKIEVQGPDALEFLNRFYINDLLSLKPGRARYGLMLRETGTLFDDGTIVALGPEHFLITTTSGNSGRVLTWLEEWHQCEWPHLRLAITSVTEQWANLTLTGPRAREILSKVSTSIDLSPKAFPHLEFRQGLVDDIPARIYRVSFTGELTYEINVPARAAPRLWQKLLQVGATEGVAAFGMEALLLLRLEKGFLHLGSDTDGTTVPEDVNWGHVASRKTLDYIGKRSLSLSENVRADRRQLVGLKIQGSTRGQHFVVGSHLRYEKSNEATDGWITSAGRGVLSGEPIAMAVLRRGRERMGSVVTVWDSGHQLMTATVVEPMFFDATGERMRA